MLNQTAQNLNCNLNGAAAIAKQALALVSIVIAFGWAWTVAAQQHTSREVEVSTLKQQLLDLELKETRLRMRLEELDEQLKPESIERELAGIGSVHPEELREHRRKLLTIEQTGIQTQLDLLEDDRARIEATIASAETGASLEDAQPPPSRLMMTAPAKPITKLISLGDLGIQIRKLYVAFGMLVLLGSGSILVLIVAGQKVEQRIVSIQSRSSSFQSNRNFSADSLRPTELRPLKSIRGVQS